MILNMKLPTILGITFSAFSVSVKVRPISSDPPYENITTSSAEKIDVNPFGKNPPACV
ncbi:hypothetical protein D3C74_482070 [compost metagenome]